MMDKLVFNKLKKWWDNGIGKDKEFYCKSKNNCIYFYIQSAFSIYSIKIGKCNDKYEIDAPYWIKVEGWPTKRYENHYNRWQIYSKSFKLRIFNKVLNDVVIAIMRVETECLKKFKEPELSNSRTEKEIFNGFCLQCYSKCWTNFKKSYFKTNLL